MGFLSKALKKVVPAGKPAGPRNAGGPAQAVGMGMGMARRAAAPANTGIMPANAGRKGPPPMLSEGGAAKPKAKRK